MSFGIFQFRRGISAEWIAVNPVLASGEIGLETDSSQIKLGDGTSPWNSLSYGGIQGPQGIQGQQGIQGEPGVQGITGDTGDQGIQGPPGTPGPTYTADGFTLDLIGTQFKAKQFQLLTSVGANTTGRGIATTGTSETVLFKVQIPANVPLNSKFRITVVLQSSGTGTLTPRVRAGAAGTTADTQLVQGVSAAGTANSYVTVCAIVTVIALGATGTTVGNLWGQSTSASFGSAATAEVLANVNNANPWFITFSGAASAGTYTVRQATVETI